MIVTFIPAAGHSSRMGGRDKLLETINGEPVLARAARIAVTADLGPVLIGLRLDDKARRKVLAKANVTFVDVPDADNGMSASLRAGAVKAIQEISAHHEGDYAYSGMMVLLPDMPEITTKDLETINKVYQAHGGPCVRATDDTGNFGHPTLFPPHVLKDFETLTGDTGAARMIEGERVETVTLGRRARLDLDTPEDWTAWRADTNTPH